MMRRIFIALLGGSAVAWLLGAGIPAAAQQRPKVPRVGVLWPGAPPDKWDQAFRHGLGTYGYVDEQNILLEYRWAEGKQERLPELAKELIQLKVDLIVTMSAPAILAVKTGDGRDPRRLRGYQQSGPLGICLKSSAAGRQPHRTEPHGSGVVC